MNNNKETTIEAEGVRFDNSEAFVVQENLSLQDNAYGASSQIPSTSIFCFLLWSAMRPLWLYQFFVFSKYGNSWRWEKDSFVYVSLYDTINQFISLKKKGISHKPRCRVVMSDSTSYDSSGIGWCLQTNDHVVQLGFYSLSIIQDQLPVGIRVEYTSTTSTILPKEYLWVGDHGSLPLDALSSRKRVGAVVQHSHASG
jgi:hypothetical protein